MYDKELENKTIIFQHRKFGSIGVIIFVNQKRIMFDDEELREKLKIDTDEYLESGDLGGLADISNIFEYLRYAKVDKETRWDFEEWISEIILDCAKLI